MLHGIDISNYQGSPDFQPIDSQQDFVIMRASEGMMRDASLTRNQEECRKWDIPRGYYHFARPDLGNSPEVEADFFLNQVEAVFEEEMIFLDFEVNYADAVGWCKRFLDRVKIRLDGYKALIYLNQADIAKYDWTPIINADHGLWVADPDGDSINAPETKWPFVAFKQYSWTGNVEGIVGATDLNTFYGDQSQLKKYGWINPASQPTPEPEPIPEEPVITVKVTYEIFINGVEMSENAIYTNFDSALYDYDLYKKSLSVGETISLRQYENYSNGLSSIANLLFYTQDMNQVPVTPIPSAKDSIKVFISDMVYKLTSRKFLFTLGSIIAIWETSGLSTKEQMVGSLAAVIAYLAAEGGADIASAFNRKDKKSVDQDPKL